MPGNNGAKRLAPEFRLRINGSEPPPRAIADLVAVTVHEDVGAPGMFTLQLINWDMSRGEVTSADDALFAEANEVKIEMGYAGNLEQLMVGEITGLEPEFSADEVPKLTVRGYDRGHRLLRGRKTRSFAKMTDSDIASQIAGGVGLSAVADSTPVVLDYVLQHNQTDMEFLEERAFRNGYEVVVQDKKLYFGPPQITGGTVLTLTRDGDLIEFYPRLSTLNQVDQVTVRGWDPNHKKELVHKASGGQETARMGGSTTGPAAAKRAFGQAGIASVDRPVFTSDEAAQIAKGQFNDMALAYITGEGICVGRTDLRARTVIKVEGLGTRFSGPYYVTSTTHTYVPARGYRTAFTVRRNAT